MVVFTEDVVWKTAARYVPDLYFQEHQLAITSLEMVVKCPPKDDLLWTLGRDWPVMNILSEGTDMLNRILFDHSTVINTVKILLKVPNYVSKDST